MILKNESDKKVLKVFKFLKNKFCIIIYIIYWINIYIQIFLYTYIYIYTHFCYFYIILLVNITVYLSIYIVWLWNYLDSKIFKLLRNLLSVKYLILIVIEN